MFGRKTKEQKEIEHKQKMQELEKKGLVYYTKYLGGLKRFPKEQHAKIIIYPDRVELQPMNVRIPYTHLKNIESIHGGKKIDSDRVFATGVIGLLWQKNRLNTILEYTDDLGESQTLVLDLLENVKYIQPRIYDHMINSKLSPND
jgi:hypothetical protein